MTTSHFAGARVFVTGGTSGIGRALAVALARAGADVVASGTTERSVAATVAAHPEVHGIVCDLANDDSLRAAVDTLRSRFDRLDILVNNAGVQANYVFSSDAAAVALAEIDREIAINLAGPIKLVSLALPLMAKGGTVVNVSSGTAWTGKPDAAVYSATKAGISMFSRVLRRQLAPHGIRTAEVYPPVTATAMTAARRGAFASPEAVAARILAGLSSGEGEIVVGKLPLLRMVNRLSPRLAEAIVARQA
jgi:uncharacterized oxidoreductase